MRPTSLLAVCAAILGLSAAAEAAQVRLNEATAEQFASIDGVDADEAARIVSLRQQRGHLGSVEALRVLQLDQETLDALRNGVVVDLTLDRESGRTFKTVEEVLANFASEPDIRAVQAMAMSYTKTNADLVEGWMRASRQAYLLPKVNLQYEKEFDYTDTYDYVLADDGDLESQLDKVDAGDDDKYVVKLEWRLDKLVMSSERIRVINEAQDIVKLRDKVLDEITRLYFDRRRLQVDRLLNPPSDLKAQIESELRYQELTANLDAFTGGAFSASLPR